MKNETKEFLKKFWLAKKFRERLNRRKNISYSQCGEDLIAKFFLPNKKNGFYVDIGSNDPVHLSNTYLFYKMGWRGICVEPEIRRWKQIRKIRRQDTALNIGSGVEKGEMDFYSFDPDTLSTFSLAEAEEFKKLGHKLVTIKKVPAWPLKEILQNYATNRQIDLLSIDTEGRDYEILQSNDWQNFRPTAVIAETAEYRKEFMIRDAARFDTFFKNINYIKLADTYINSIYLEGDYARSRKLESLC